LGIGAIAEGGVSVLNDGLIAEIGVGQQALQEVMRRENDELQRRVERYRGGLPATPLNGRLAILVDDGLATGYTARAAIDALRKRGAAKVVLAVPVAPEDAVKTLSAVADEVIAVETPPFFFGIGEFYADFRQTSDEEVIVALRDAAVGPTMDRSISEDVQIDAAGVRLPGNLVLPADLGAIVVFVHGSGSSRLSPRNRYVADVLNDAGLGTLLFDLLTPEEEADRANVFDIRLLAERLESVTRWLRSVRGVSGDVGYFGASTGAAAALWAAAGSGDDVYAIVSRGGRPDLAMPHLPAVHAPTLLIVGGSDETVLELNREAQAQLRCPNELAIVPGATHLFEEPGALEAVAERARDWFLLWRGH
jgi:predicted phosphoribosyltransferase/dienelactone hydrolase